MTDQIQHVHIIDVVTCSHPEKVIVHWLASLVTLIEQCRKLQVLDVSPRRMDGLALETSNFVGPLYPPTFHQHSRCQDKNSEQRETSGVLSL
jgi:hypothetical protein